MNLLKVVSILSTESKQENSRFSSSSSSFEDTFLKILHGELKIRGKFQSLGYIGNFKRKTLDSNFAKVKDKTKVKLLDSILLNPIYTDIINISDKNSTVKNEKKGNFSSILVKKTKEINILKKTSKLSNKTNVLDELITITKKNLLLKNSNEKIGFKLRNKKKDNCPIPLSKNINFHTKNFKNTKKNSSEEEKTISPKNNNSSDSFFLKNKSESVHLKDVHIGVNVKNVNIENSKNSNSLSGKRSISTLFHSREKANKDYNPVSGSQDLKNNHKFLFPKKRILRNFLYKGKITVNSCNTSEVNLNILFNDDKLKKEINNKWHHQDSYLSDGRFGLDKIFNNSLGEKNNLNKKYSQKQKKEHNLKFSFLKNSSKISIKRSVILSLYGGNNEKKSFNGKLREEKIKYFKKGNYKNLLQSELIYQRELIEKDSVEKNSSNKVELTSHNSSFIRENSDTCASNIGLNVLTENNDLNYHFFERKSISFNEPKGRKFILSNKKQFSLTYADKIVNIKLSLQGKTINLQLLTQFSVSPELFTELTSIIKDYGFVPGKLYIRSKNSNYSSTSKVKERLELKV